MQRDSRPRSSRSWVEAGRVSLRRFDQRRTVKACIGALAVLSVLGLLLTAGASSAGPGDDTPVESLDLSSSLAPMTMATSRLDNQTGGSRSSISPAAVLTPTGYLPYLPKDPTPTPTPTPTPSPTPTPRPPLLDDFSNPQSGWSVAESDNTKAGYDNGEYVILIKTVGWTRRGARNLTAGDFRFEIDARASGQFNGWKGLYFGYGSLTGYYAFLTAFQGYLLARVDSAGKWTTVATQPYNAAISGGNAMNRLKAVRVGTTITLFVNGQQVGQAVDSTYGEGFFGLIASSPQSEVSLAGEARFDNFLLYYPPFPP